MPVYAVRQALEELSSNSTWIATAITQALCRVTPESGTYWLPVGSCSTPCRRVWMNQNRQLGKPRPGSAVCQASKNGRKPACGAAVRTCERRVRTCGSHVRTCGSRVRTCGSPVRTCGSRVRTCGSRVRTRGSHVRTCGSRVRTCGSRVRTCGSRVRTCGSRVRTSGSHVRTCGSRVRTWESRVRTCVLGSLECGGASHRFAQAAQAAARRRRLAPPDESGNWRCRTPNDEERSAQPVRASHRSVSEAPGCSIRRRTSRARVNARRARASSPLAK